MSSPPKPETNAITLSDGSVWRPTEGKANHSDHVFRIWLCEKGTDSQTSHACFGLPFLATGDLTAFDLRAIADALDPRVSVPTPLANEQDAKGGWTYDPKFLQQIAEQVESEEDEGQPSMELVEAVIKTVLRQVSLAPVPAQRSEDNEASDRALLAELIFAFAGEDITAAGIHANAILAAGFHRSVPDSHWRADAGMQQSTEIRDSSEKAIRETRTKLPRTVTIEILRSAIDLVERRESGRTEKTNAVIALSDLQTLIDALIELMLSKET